jgi:hypothetical protein
VALGVPARLRTRIFSNFGTTRVVGRQPNAPAAFTQGEIPGTHFQRLSRPQGTWFCRKEPRKKSQVTLSGIDSVTVRLVAQRLNHYANPSPFMFIYPIYNHDWRNISTTHIYTHTHTHTNIYIYIYIYIIRLASNEIFSPSNEIYRGVGLAKDLLAPLY